MPVGSWWFCNLCRLEMAKRYACVVEDFNPCFCKCAANMATVLEDVGHFNGVCITS